MTDQISVYLLDDHEIVRRGLRELLAATDDIAVVGESGLAEEVVRRIPALRPDVAIFDARLPDGSGIDACRRVRSVDPTLRGNRIVEAIRRVAAGENLLDTQPAPELADRWRAGLETDSRLRALTPQERLVLAHIAEGLTNRQIGEAMSLAETTVKNYITSVLAKMGLERRTQAAVYAVQHPSTPSRRAR
jgi:two-component system, NarL family, response regulator DevR